MEETVNERILVIEDDEALARLITLQLERAGYQVATCEDGPSGIDYVRTIQPDLILLDIMLPGIDGWETCRLLQEITDAPILFLSALGSDQNLDRGLGLGADDYIVKPFSYKELLARVKAALHRAQRSASQQRTYHFDRLTVDLQARTVEVDGERVLLTPLEYKLLATLVQEAGSVVTHEALLRRVWGPQYEDRRQYLKLYVWYLRQKIEQNPSHPRIILNERGVGYRLASASEPL
ncbi:MAG: response regulator transcription factor [Chloroflexi bacterium]|nr:response regulator transcription factor [Chloroflexota bacterium]